jgi:PEP-CTERM motif
MKKHLAFGAAFAFLLTASTARAQLIAVEQFVYTSGQSLVGQNGGSGFGGPWSQVFAGGPNGNTIAPGSLTPAAPSDSLPTAGNSLSISASGGGSFEAQRSLATPLPGTVGTTIWLSVVMKGTGSTGSTAQGVLLFGDTSGNGFSITTGAVGFGVAPNNPPTSSTWSLGDGGNGAAEAVSNIPNTLQSLLVVGDTFGATSDTINLYVNPPLTGTPPTTPNAVNTVPHTASFTRFDVNYSSLGSASTSTLFDEIRAGNTFADVTGTAVPEPSTMLLLGFAGLGWIARRRR